MNPCVDELPNVTSLGLEEAPFVFAHNNRVAALEEEAAELDTLVGAATLTATAFRLRDESALIQALRALVRSVQQLETLRAA